MVCERRMNAPLLHFRAARCMINIIPKTVSKRAKRRLVYIGAGNPRFSPYNRTEHAL